MASWKLWSTIASGKAHRLSSSRLSTLKLESGGSIKRDALTAAGSNDGQAGAAPADSSFRVERPDEPDQA